MIDNLLLAKVQAGNVEGVRALVASGADIHARDEHGWTVLSWAAGAGHTEVARLLLDRGADVFAAGEDGRTPYTIALAAGRIEAARLLAGAEAARGQEAAARSSGKAAHRPYCRGYRVGDLRRFPGWTQAGSPSGESGSEQADGEDTIVFVHRDFSVTRSIWAGEALVFHGTSDDWRRFCTEQLQFKPPDDFELAGGPAGG